MSDSEPLRFEMDRLVSYDDESILEEMRRVAALLPPGPITRQAFNDAAHMSEGTLRRRFGGWQAALDRAGLSERFSRPGADVSADDVIADLQRIAALLGRKRLTLDDVREHGHQATERSISLHFRFLWRALEAAALEWPRHAQRWTDMDYFDNLLEVWTRYGRAPTKAEIGAPPSRITAAAYARKFGSWARAKQAFVGQVNADMADSQVQAMPGPVVVPAAQPARPRQEDEHAIPVGLRYQVLRRDSFRCVTCGRSPAMEAGCVLHVDHVTAFSRGGKTRLDNLRSLCDACNLGKGAGDA